MTSLLAKSVTQLAAAQQRVAGVAVTYRRGAYTVDLTAVPGLTTMEEENVDGAVVTSVVPDFIIEAADLVIDGETTKPLRFDRIEWDGRVYELLSTGASRSYDYTDQYRTMFRVHTKEISVEQ